MDLTHKQDDNNGTFKARLNINGRYQNLEFATENGGDQFEVTILARMQGRWVEVLRVVGQPGPALEVQWRESITGESQQSSTPQQAG
jgi:hypothetical protein